MVLQQLMSNCNGKLWKEQGVDVGEIFSAQAFVVRCYCFDGAWPVTSIYLKTSPSFNNTSHVFYVQGLGCG
jgi:hypothetical protein